MPTMITASEATVELPPIRVSKSGSRTARPSATSATAFKEAEPGADPLARKLVIAVVRPGSPAATAGLKPGDEIVSVDGTDVSGPNAYLYGTLTRVLEGTTVTFGLVGGGSVAVVAGKRP